MSESTVRSSAKAPAAKTAAEASDRAQAERAKALGDALGMIEKAFGKNSIMRLGDKPQKLAGEVIGTGSIALDIALGVGGLPKGRIVEIYGPEASGKTTLALQVAAQAQKKGGVAAFIDAEHALDPVYARKLGVNVADLLVSQPSCGEEALEIASKLVASNAVDVVVIDSVAALVPKAEIEGEMGDSHMGLHARLMSQALRKLTGAVAKSNCLIVFINQIRMKIGIMFGNPETTTGGHALKFYASVRLDVRKIGVIKEKEEAIGTQVKVKIVKNKVAPPFRQVEFELLFNQGVSREGELLEMGLVAEAVEKSGSWWSYDGQRIGQGKEAARAFLKEHPEIADAIEAKIRAVAEDKEIIPVDNSASAAEAE